MRTRNVFFSLISSFVYQFVAAIANFITLRLFLTTYGSEINGLNYSVMQIIGYLNLVEAGIALTAIQALYKPLAKGDWKVVNGVLFTANDLYKKSGLLFIIIVCLTSLLYPFLIDTTIPSEKISTLIFIMAGGSILEYFINGKMRVLLMADQKSYIINYFQVITIVISSFLRIILMLKGYDFLLVQWAYTISILFRVVLTHVYIKKKYPYINYKGELDNKVLKNRWSVLFHQIAGLFVFNSQIIIISIFCSLEEASVYAVYNIVFSSLILVIQMFSKSIVASFGNLISQEDNSALIKVFRQYEAIFYAFSGVIYSVAFLLINSFIYLFTSGVNDIKYQNHILAIMFTVIGLANIVRVPSNTLIEAAGHYKQTQYRALVEAIINISFSLILVQFIGIYGVLLGSVLSYAYRMIDIIIYANKYILKEFSLKAYKGLCINFIIFTLTIIVVDKIGINITTWLQFIISGFILVIVFGSISIIINEIIYPGLINDIKGRLNRIFVKT